MVTKRTKRAKVTIFHATAPTCHWSWGFEPVLNRVKTVYGDQVDVRLLMMHVYDDLDSWIKEYDFKDWSEVLGWFGEIAPQVGLPIDYARAKDAWPKDVLPVSLACFAALRQGAVKGERFFRATLRMATVEARDTTSDAALDEAAREAGLDVARFRGDLEDGDGLMKQYGSQGEGFPHAPLNFYNLVLSDGNGRMVVLDHAFDPKVVEDAIDYLGGKLAKAKPKDVLGYLAHHGWASQREVERAFALKPPAAKKQLDALVKAGKAEKTKLAGATHWRAQRSSGKRA